MLGPPDSCKPPFPGLAAGTKSSSSHSEWQLKRSEPFLQTALPSPPLAGVHRAAANYPEDIPGVPISSGKPGPPSHTNPHPKLRLDLLWLRGTWFKPLQCFLPWSPQCCALWERQRKIILNVTIDCVRRCDKMTHKIYNWKKCFHQRAKRMAESKTTVLTCIIWIFNFLIFCCFYFLFFGIYCYPLCCYIHTLYLFPLILLFNLSF